MIDLTPIGPQHVSKKHRGAHSELVAVAWLIEQGYEVFRNVSQHGKVDIVVLNEATKEFIPIDVKTLSSYRTVDGQCRTGYPSKKDFHVVGQIRFVLVNPKTGKCEWGNGDEPR